MSDKIKLNTKMDRTLQRMILTALANSAPRTISDEYLDMIFKHTDEETIAFNVHYLSMHGLMTHQIEKYFYAGEERLELIPNAWAITEKGIDFMFGDGGLSAILGVVTIKLHDETIRDLIVQRILEANPPDKHKLIDAIRELPSEYLKHLSMKLIDKGLENWPATLAAIGTICAQ